MPTTESRNAKPGWLSRWEERQQAEFDRRAAATSGAEYDDWGTPLGPHLASPHSSFRYKTRDGYASGQVDVSRVTEPLWLTVYAQRLSLEGPGASLVILLLAVFVSLPLLVWRRIRRVEDRRWRLAVLHGRRVFPGIPRTVLVELFDTEEAADARRMEILAHWSEVDWAG